MNERAARVPRAMSRCVAWLLSALVVAAAAPARAQTVRVDLVDLDDPSAAPHTQAFDEASLALAGAEMAIARGEVPASEASELRASLREGYARMAREHGPFPSPLESGPIREAGGHDTVRIHPAEGASDVGVLFLHGRGGSFTLPCWAIARALASLRPTVLCPHEGMDGAWWSAAGRARARLAASRLAAEGARSILLVGLSNGARGAGVIARRDRLPLAGLVLVSGASSGAPARVPTLLVTGDADRMFAPRASRAYAARLGSQATLRELHGGHFALLARLDEASAAMDAWARALPR